MRAARGLVSGTMAGAGSGLLALAVTLVLAGLMVGAALAWVAYGLYAAYQVYQGRDFRYWLIGDLTARG